MPDGRAAHYHGPQGECARLAAFGQAGSRSTRSARVRPRGRYQAGFNGGEESTRWERACSLSSEGVSLHGHSSDDYEPPWCLLSTPRPSGRGLLGATWPKEAAARTMFPGIDVLALVAVRATRLYLATGRNERRGALALLVLIAILALL